MLSLTTEEARAFGRSVRGAGVAELTLCALKSVDKYWHTQGAARNSRGLPDQLLCESTRTPTALATGLRHAAAAAAQPRKGGRGLRNAAVDNGSIEWLPLDGRALSLGPCGVGRVTRARSGVWVRRRLAIRQAARTGSAQGAQGDSQSGADRLACIYFARIRP